MEAIIKKVRQLLDANSIVTDRERVETLITNFHSTPETVTLALVKRAVRKVDRTSHLD